MAASESDWSCPLRCEADRLWCAGEARRFAQRLGFGDHAQWELAIVVAELVSNAVRYAGTGTLRMRPAPGARRGIEITVSDHGPGIDLGGAARTARRPGLGIGLRIVHCLMQRVSLEAAPDHGTVVTAVRFLEP
jgi:serine/threonine-protein kinase RsbT